MVPPIDAHERELTAKAGETRARIEELITRLHGLDTEIENLRTARKPLLALPEPPATEVPVPPEVPEHPAYRQILTVFTDTGRPMRAQDLCRPLDLPIVPKNTESIHFKLKCLVSTGRPH
ncbi:hypothetical protein ACFZBM_30570 [Streptomyces lavendulae]|uniref:hypothetical protein n=1 Tax=Streptomyces lavendulae TaxID=1914 RepID=UPI0036E63A19